MNNLEIYKRLEDWGVMLLFFPKKYFDAILTRKNYFCKEKII
jgi:hypothetical protein